MHSIFADHVAGTPLHGNIHHGDTEAQRTERHTQGHDSARAISCRVVLCVSVSLW